LFVPSDAGSRRRTGHRRSRPSTRSPNISLTAPSCLSPLSDQRSFHVVALLVQPFLCAARTDQLQTVEDTIVTGFSASELFGHDVVQTQFGRRLTAIALPQPFRDGLAASIGFTQILIGARGALGDVAKPIAVQNEPAAEEKGQVERRVRIALIGSFSQPVQ